MMLSHRQDQIRRLEVVSLQHAGSMLADVCAVLGHDLHGQLAGPLALQPRCADRRHLNLPRQMSLGQTPAQ